MKRFIIILGILVVVIGGLLFVFFTKENVKDFPVVFVRYLSDSEGYVYKGKISVLNDGKETELSDLFLAHASMPKEDTLVGVQNLFPKAEGFQGIVIFNTEQKEVTEILPTDKVYEGLDDEPESFRGNIQMSKDEKDFYFICGEKVFYYNREEDNPEVIFKADTYQILLNENNTGLYFSERNKLYYYDFADKRKELKFGEEVYNFTVSADENFLVYENRDQQKLYMYNFKTKENKKIANLKYMDNKLELSTDNRYLLYTDYAEAFVPTNLRTKVYLYDLNNGKKRLVYNGIYEENITNAFFYK